VQCSDEGTPGVKDKPGYKGSIYIIWRVDGSEDHYAHDMFYDCALLLRIFLR
jgi:hypothetical protein